MLYWNAQGGISPDNDLSTLSDVDFIDKSAFIGIVVTQNISRNTFANLDELYNFYNSLDTSYSDTQYAVPIKTYGDKRFYSFSEVLTYFPSIETVYPNLSSTISTSPRTTILYIPSLYRLVQWSFSKDRGTIVYSVDGNNLTKILTINVGQIGPLYLGEYIKNIGFKNFVDMQSLTEEQYIQIETTLYRPAITAVIGNVNARYKDFMNALFTVKYGGKQGEEPYKEIKPPNPYEPGGDSGEGGGGGAFDDSSDQITDSTPPTISSANTGFTRIYNPTLSQVQDLARYLWTDSSVIETIWNHIKQFFENPMEAIIGFNLVPVPVPNGGTQNFALMYIDTGVEMTVAASQFVDVDCGTFELKEYYGSALDYSPNTKVSCFLPFIGTVSLNTDEVMGRTLQVKYRVDICSGSCVAKISVDGNFIYQYSGHCAINIPISAADFSSYVSSAISVAKLAGGALAAGAAGVVGAGAVEAVQQTNQVVTTTQITNTARNPATGRQITTGTTTRVETRESPTDQSSTQASFSGLTPQNIANTVGQIMTSKPSIEHSGSFSGNSGYLGVRRPFLIIERPNMCMPANFQALNGFPSMITLELSTCKGFTRVQQVQLTGLSATNPEQAEILQLLKSGVVM